MKKEDIIKLIQANKTIDKYKDLLSTILTKSKYYSNYISEELWFPDIPEFQEYFDILKKELLQAKKETIQSQDVISTTTCNHEVRLNYHSAFGGTNYCVLCGKKVPNDNVISFGQLKDKNNHAVIFDAKYQSDDDGSYLVENGKTMDEVRDMILEILKDHDEEEVDLVEEFSKLNLINEEINTKIIKEKHI